MRQKYQIIESVKENVAQEEMILGKIMLIDDELETLEIHKSYLEDEHEVYAFSSGTDALAQIVDVKPDIILLDIEMPFLDGFEVLERIRELRDGAEIPIVGVTGQKNKTTALNFLGKGGVAYLTKPVEKKLMQEKVNEILQKTEERKNRKKILLVDDELESLLIYKTVLQEKYNVMALNSSKTALAYLQKFVPDLIVLDYQMPLYNGRALYQMISKMERLKDVPVLFLTGTTDKEVLLECATLLPQGVILKAAGKDALLERIKSIIG